MNKLFETPDQYQPGSIEVWLNGLILLKDGDDGWFEQGNRKILMKVAPKENDVVQAYYNQV